MFVVAMVALFAAVAPAQEVVEEFETQETVLSEECDSLAYEDLECLEDLVFEDAENEDSLAEDAIAFDEE